MFYYQLKNELWKLFGKKRTYIGFTMFVVGQFLISIVSRFKGQGRMLQDMQRTGFEPELYLSMLTFATGMVGALAFLLVPIFVSLIGGDLVSKEAEDGTLRMILSRPISRIRLLFVKWLAGIIFSFSIVFALGFFALIFSAIWFPVKGGMFVFLPGRLLGGYGFSAGLGHYALAHLFMVPMACTVMSLAFMFSCFNMKPAAATILALSLSIIDRVMMSFPYFEDIQYWFLSHYLDSWLAALNSPVQWWEVWQAWFVMAAANLTFLVIGATVFQVRDIKS
jgi:ABC-2 type transport system permease protein